MLKQCSQFVLSYILLFKFLKDNLIESMIVGTRLTYEDIMIMIKIS